MESANNIANRDSKRPKVDLHEVLTEMTQNAEDEQTRQEIHDLMASLESGVA